MSAIFGQCLKSSTCTGYPLCLDTYAASELNLQEAMFAGIPPVVFPHGGIQLLVKHNETGLVVHSNQEYRDAIAYLYNNPSERLRLGANAAEYSKRHFGARNNAPKMIGPIREAPSAAETSQALARIQGSWRYA